MRSFDAIDNQRKHETTTGQSCAAGLETSMRTALPEPDPRKDREFPERLTQGDGSTPASKEERS